MLDVDEIRREELLNIMEEKEGGKGVYGDGALSTAFAV